jgi:hypothetical protein
MPTAQVAAGAGAVTEQDGTSVRVSVEPHAYLWLT